MKRGEIVLITYPFSNLQGTKVRPALVISSDKYNQSNRDALFILITSNTSDPQPSDYLIDPKHPDFPQAGLKKASLIRVDKIVCLMQSLARRKLGSISSNIQIAINDILRKIIDL